MRLKQVVDLPQHVRQGYDRLTVRWQPLDKRRERALLVFLAFVLVVSRLIFIVANPVRIIPRTDESGYLMLGRELTRWWSNGNAVRGPGYPAFIALGGGNVHVVQVMQVALELGGMITLLLTVRRIWGQLPMVATGLLWVTYGAFIYYDYGVLSETLATQLVVGIGALLLLLWHKHLRRPLIWFGALGVLIGLFGLVRLGAIAPFAVTALVVLVRRYGPWRRAVPLLMVLFVGIMLPTAPWLVRNDRLYGRLLTTTTLGHGLLVGAVPDSFEIAGLRLSLSKLGYSFGSPDFFTNTRFGMYNRGDLKENQHEGQIAIDFLERHASDYAWPLLSDHALRPVKNWLLSAVWKNEIGVYKPLRGDAMLGLFRAAHLAIVLLAAISAAVIPGLRRAAYPWMVLIGLVTLASVALPSQSRYLLPFVPFVIAGAAIGAMSVVLGLLAARERAVLLTIEGER
jgi:hypothetical protein